MRPRVFPAEDGRERAHGPGHAGASMRPRVFPAEDTKGRWPPNVLLDASMRPRVFPAEDVLSAACGAVSPTCFNEAAGIPRGRLGVAARLARRTLLLQ